MKTIIWIQNLTKIYEEGGQKLEVLKNINLKVKKGEFIAIMGPSGSGKTTLLNIIGCLDRPSGGFYKLDTEEISQKSQKELAQIRNQKIGFIFQTFNLLPRYNVVANVALPTVYFQKPKRSKRKILELLEKVNLRTRAFFKPNQLSGGEQQRVAIARALINSPWIILADEPTGNLDRESEKEVMKILKELNQEGVTLILVTHDTKIAKEAQKIIKLEDGEMSEYH